MAGGKRQKRNRKAGAGRGGDAADRQLKERWKEFRYVLQLSDAEAQVLGRYHGALSNGAARFAETYYNYLFDNPATANALYAYERGGGDVGDLVRAELNQLLALLTPEMEESHEPYAVAGNRHLQAGIEPLWILGGYRLYLEHLRDLIAALDIEDGDRRLLEAALHKRLFQVMGMAMEACWEARLAQVAAERDQAVEARGRIEAMLGNIPQILWSVDVSSGQVVYASPATHKLCEAPVEGPIPCFEQTHEEDRERLSAAWQSALDGGQATEVVRIRPRGTDPAEERWYQISFYPFAVRRRVNRIDALMEDVTEQQEALSRLEHLATTDELTELANRTLWYDRVNQAISRCRRNETTKVVLMLLDLDHFKVVNDTLGHPAGDELLRQVARRLQSALRDSDTLARLGGDEFAVLMPAVDDARRAGERVARKILECFKEPYWFEGEELFFSTSIGIAVYPDHGADTDTLLSRADIAMYRAKRGDQGYAFYERGSDSGSANQLQVSGQLRYALERNEFELYYQPKVSLRGERLAGAEALLRWRHPQEGLVPPARFLHIAEQIGLMSPITNWVLVTALRQCRAWREETGLELPVSVNVSARSFQTPRLLDRIQWALNEAGVDGSQLEIEITEDTLMSDLDHGVRVLRRLADLGVRVAVDDFGTGYSSLSYLKRLPLHTLKIDRSFLLDMVENENDAVIVRSIIDLGHNLGFEVVAEGVENQACWELLEVLGCDAVQGFHVSRPLAGPSFTDWLGHGGWHPSPAD